MLDMAKEHGALLPRRRGGRAPAPSLSLSSGGSVRKLAGKLLSSPWALVIGKTVVVFLALLALAALGHASLARTAEASTPIASSLKEAGPSPGLPSPEASPPLFAASPVEPGPSTPKRETDASARASPILPDGRIVLNLAGQAELTKLPGIGPKRADAILELRAKLGRFRRVEDLLRVKGIGRKMLARLRPALVVDAPPSEEPSAKRGGAEG